MKASKSFTFLENQLIDFHSEKISVYLFLWTGLVERIIGPLTLNKAYGERTGQEEHIKNVNWSILNIRMKHI